MENTKFCVAPFRNAVINTDGLMMPCCDFVNNLARPTPTHTIKDINSWWTEGLDSLRNDMIDGRVNPGCTNCVSKETNSHYRSERQRLNSQYGRVNNLQLDRLEIRVSNYCNLGCIMCGPYASSTLATEYQQHTSAYHKIGIIGAYEPTVRWWDDLESISNLKAQLGTITHLSFAGGEPLIVPEVVELLDSVNVDRIKSIHITTNLTRLTDKFLMSIERFNNISITVSLEGTSQHNDYIRYGSDWTTIKNNISTLKNLNNVVLQINHVLQHTSIFALPQLIEYADANQITMLLHEVSYNSYPEPGVLGLNSAHHSDVEEFKLWLDSYQGKYKRQLTSWIQSYQFDDNLYTKFHAYVTMIDNIRGVSFNKTFNPTYKEKQSGT